MCATSLVLLAILAQTSPLTADPQAKAQAQELLGQGTKLYAQGDVAGALEKFDAAYAAYASPKLMFNIGQCNRDLSRPVEALEAFEKFLVGAADASPDMIADARKSVAQLAEEAGTNPGRLRHRRCGGERRRQERGAGAPARSDLGHSWPPPGHGQARERGTGNRGGGRDGGIGEHGDREAGPGGGSRGLSGAQDCPGLRPASNVTA